MIVLIGCVSISSKAAALQPATEVKFEGDHYHYKTASKGYYTVLLSRKSGQYTHWYTLEKNEYRSKNLNVNRDVSTLSEYEMGKVTLYVICHPAEKTYNISDGITPYKKDKTCKIAASEVADVNKRMPKVTGVKVAPATDIEHEDMYKVSWKADGARHWVYVTTSYGAYAGVKSKGTTSIYINMTPYVREIQIRTISTDLSTTADSEIVTVYAPAVDADKLYNLGSYTIDLTNGPVTVNDTKCPIALCGILNYTNYKITEETDEYALVNVDLDNDNTMDISVYETDNLTKFSLLPTNSIKDQITLVIGEKGKKECIANERKYYSYLTFLVPKAAAPATPNPGTGTTVNGKPIDAASISQIVTVNGITYIIDVNNKATAIKINTKKKAVLNKVTANGTTYPVVAIADNACKNNKKIKALSIGSNVTSIGKDAFKGCKKLKKITIKANRSLTVGKGAFKKIGKKATIRIKGIKGKARKKLIKSIKS